MKKTPQGFALLIAVVLTSVTLTIGLAILDVAYKQIILATTAKQSQYAFYNAESAMECALYYDQKFDSFNYVTANTTGTGILCTGVAVAGPYRSNIIGASRVTTFTKTCPAGGTSASVSIYKNISGKTDIYTSGFNSCNVSEPRRIERALKTTY